MDELESQIAKIQLGNLKHTSSYVHVMAEKAAGSDAELYLIAELPMLNPAAEESCEKICLSIASTLKRAYKKPLSESTFENAISQINEELGKLAALGQAHWIDKLSAIVAVKRQSIFTIATCGKVAAFMLRNNEYTDISCSPSQSHPLKTFENYASGKIKLGDLLILSTNQMFNYLSMDRMKNILTSAPFLNATQTIIELLKENAGPEVAFGTLLNLQVETGQAEEEQIDLENYIVERPTGQPGKIFKAISYVKTVFAFDKSGRRPKVELPKVSVSQKLNRLKTIGGNTRNLIYKSKGAVTWAKKALFALGRLLDFRDFKNFSKEKKFFLISALILLAAFTGSLAIASRYNKNQTAKNNITQQLKNIQDTLSNAQTSLLYKDDSSAKNYLVNAKTSLPKDQNGFTKDNKDALSKINSQIAELTGKLEKNMDAKVSTVSSLGETENLIKLPSLLAVQINGSIISYNTTDGKTEDNKVKLDGTAVSSVYLGKNLSVIFNGKGLQVWDTQNGKTYQEFTQNVPGQGDFAGLAVYNTNNRVYTVNKSTGQIFSFLVNNNSLSKPVVAGNSPDLRNGVDLAIDSSIYVLTKGGISKFQAGKPAAFSMPLMITPFSGQGKIYTQKDFKSIYVLDSGNNRIIILDKKGALVGTIASKDFTKLKDFQIDEASKTIYLLNGGSLLKVEF